MPIINEDFIRCSCGNAEFVKEEVVTLPRYLQDMPRYGLEKSAKLPTLDKKIQYICTNCHKVLDI